MFTSKCKYSKFCIHYRETSAACKNIESNQDEYKCGVYRGFSENRPGSIGLI